MLSFSNIFLKIKLANINLLKSAKIMDFSEEYVEPDFKVLIYSKSLCNSPCPKLNNKFINLASKDKEQVNGYNIYLKEKNNANYKR